MSRRVALRWLTRIAAAAGAILTSLGKQIRLLARISLRSRSTIIVEVASVRLSMRRVEWKAPTRRRRRKRRKKRRKSASRTLRSLSTPSLQRSPSDQELEALKLTKGGE